MDEVWARLQDVRKALDEYGAKAPQAAVDGCQKLEELLEPFYNPKPKTESLKTAIELSSKDEQPKPLKLKKNSDTNIENVEDKTTETPEDKVVQPKRSGRIKSTRKVLSDYVCNTNSSQGSKKRNASKSPAASVNNGDGDKNNIKEDVNKEDKNDLLIKSPNVKGNDVVKKNKGKRKYNKKNKADLLMNESSDKNKDKDINVINKKDKDLLSSSSTNLSCNDSVLSIKSDKNIEKKNNKGESLLHTACNKKNMNQIKQLLALGANPNTKDFAGWTPLHEAINKGSLEIIELLLENGAAPYIPGPANDTALHIAVKNNQTDIVKMLMDKGGNINMRNCQGLTPLDLANDDMKNLLNCKQTKDVKEHILSSVFDKELNSQLNIYTSNTLNSQLLNNLAKHHTNLIINKNIDENTSFYITDSFDGFSCQISIDVLTAITLGIPIIRSEWLSDSNETKLADLINYKLLNAGSVNNAIHLSHLNRLNLFPPLFNNCNFYFMHFKQSYEIGRDFKVNREMLIKLVKNAGGNILKREPDPERISDQMMYPYHVEKGNRLEKCCNYIIYLNKPGLCYNMQHIKSLPIGWLIECIQNFKLVDPEVYF